MSKILLFNIVVFFALWFNLSVNGFTYSTKSSSSTGTEITVVPNKMLERLAVFPDHNFAFCLIAKVGSNALAEVIEDIPLSRGANQAAIDPVMRGYSMHSPAVYGYGAKEISDIYHNTSWTKAVFYREPISRFISGYRSKCEVGENDFAHCREEFGIKNASFDVAIRRFLSANINPLHDEHFIRQADFCGGLRANLKYFNEVHELEIHSTRELFMNILQKVNIPLTHKLMSKLDHYIPRLAPNDSRLVTNNTRSYDEKHITHSYEEKEQRKYITDNCFARVLAEYYWQDYVLFGIQFPPHFQQALLNTTSATCRERLLTSTVE